MARLTTPFSFAGPLSGLSFYTRKDGAGTFVRGRSSISKERMRTDPAFDRTRRSGAEAGGRSRAAKWIRRVLQPLEPVRDGNWAAALTGALGPVQRMDTTHAYGQRALLLSQYGHLLEGYALSRRTPWEGVVRAPLVCSLNKGGCSARVEVPELIPGATFFPHPFHPYFRVVASLGPVPDLQYTPEGYTPAVRAGSPVPAVVHTDWKAIKMGAGAALLELQLPCAPDFPSYALVLAVGILYGTPNEKGIISPVRYSGCGRIAVVG